MMVWWCFCGGGLWRWCFCGGVFVAVFLWWCFWSVCVVVFLWWWCFCGGVVVFLWWCFLWWCGGVFVVVMFFFLLGWACEWLIVVVDLCPAYVERPAYVELASNFLFVWTYLTWMNCLTILACQHLACLDLAWLVLARRFPWLDLLGLTFFLNGATCLTWLGLFALSYLTLLDLLFCRVYFFLRVYPHFKNDLWLGIVMWNAIIWGSQETPFAKTGW